MQTKDNIHKDHRKRVREKFERVGLAGFAEHEILEMVLFYAIPYKDTNPLAHKLIQHFGDLLSVFNATKDELMEVDGVSDHTATLINLITALGKDLSAREAKQVKKLNGFADSIHFASALLRKEDREVVYLICLDRKNQVKGITPISTGTATYAVVDTKQVTRYILQKNVDRIILAHNHPIGDCHPSDQDIMFTRQIIEALAPLDIEVLDHIVVSKTDAFSFAHENLIENIKRSARIPKIASIHRVTDSPAKEFEKAKK